MRNRALKDKPFWPKFILFLVFFLIVVFGFIVIKEIANQKQLDGEIGELNSEIEKLKLKKESFLALIDTYESDFQVEKEARTKFNLKKDGENVVVVKLDATNKLVSTVDDSYNNNDDIKPTDKTNNSLVLWWNYFFANK
jgi:cell division protein FtsB